MSSFIFDRLAVGLLPGETSTATAMVEEIVEAVREPEGELELAPATCL